MGTCVFRERKGANIPNFCRFSWEIVYDFEGKIKKYKPNFQLADSFCRAYGVQNWKAKVPADMTSPFEINFTRLQYAGPPYSRRIWLSLAFRDIFQRLGQILSSGRAVKIRFGCGKFLSKDRKIAFVFDQDLQVKTKKGLQEMYEKSVLKSNSRKFSVTDDAEILDLLDAPSEVGSTVSQNVSIPSPGPNAFLPLPKMSTTTSVNGDNVKSLEPMGEAAVEGNIVPTLALDQVSEKSGENIAVANNIIEKPLPNKNTQIPPFSSEKEQKHKQH